MNWDAIKGEVEKSTTAATQAAAADVCACGAPWQRMYDSQALCYDRELKAMVDVFEFYCTAHDRNNPQSCQRTKSISVPLGGQTYAEMATAVKPLVEGATGDGTGA